MALLGQQTPKIKTNLNEKKREKFGKQEELKKKNWWKDQVLLKENLILLFQNIILEKIFKQAHQLQWKIAQIK